MMKPYITPEKMIELSIGKDVPNIPKTVYIFFYKSLVEKIEEFFSLQKIKFTRGDFYIEVNNEFGIITNFGVGESGSLMLAEELSAFGVEKVIALGAVGSLSHDLKIGDMVIIESAFSQSRIEKIYKQTENEIFTSEEQNKSIQKVFEQKDISFTAVKTLSVPTIYRETHEEIEGAKEKGISVIEMEVFSLALVFAIRGINFSSIGCVSDVLYNGEWEFENNLKKVFDGLKKSFLSIVKHKDETYLR